MPKAITKPRTYTVDRLQELRREADLVGDTTSRDAISAKIVEMGGSVPAGEIPADETKIDRLERLRQDALDVKDFTTAGLLVVRIAEEEVGIPTEYVAEDDVLQAKLLLLEAAEANSSSEIVADLSLRYKQAIKCDIWGEDEGQPVPDPETNLRRSRREWKEAVGTNRPAEVVAALLWVFESEVQKDDLRELLVFASNDGDALSDDEIAFLDGGPMPKYPYRFTEDRSQFDKAIEADTVVDEPGYPQKPQDFETCIGREKCAAGIGPLCAAEDDCPHYQKYASQFITPSDPRTPPEVMADNIMGTVRDLSRQNAATEPQDAPDGPIAPHDGHTLLNNGTASVNAAKAIEKEGWNLAEIPSATGQKVDMFDIRRYRELLTKV